MIPLFVIFFYLDSDSGRIITAAIFATAAITDWFDGYLARRMNLESPFGAFLDPVADKLMVTIALILLVEMHANVWLAIPALVIIGREITISALREWMAEIGSRAVIKVSGIGKYKTTVQMVAIVILLVAPRATDHVLTMLGYIGLYLAAALTLWSMAVYLKAAWPYLSANPSEN